MSLSKLKTIAKVVVFLLIVAVLLYHVQGLVTPKWDWPDETERRSHQVKGLYLEPENTLDVLWVGASHMHAGISPMEIYRQSGVYSYNIATSGQPMPLSYQWLKTALNRQSPKVVVLDVGGCFISDKKNAYNVFWYNVMDTLPTLKVLDRLKFVDFYNKIKPESQTVSLETRINDFLPILRYHENYLLTRDNYLDIHDDKLYPRKGYVIYTSVDPAQKPDENLYGDLADVPQADAPEDQLTPEQANNRKRYAHNLQYLDAIRQMCQEHGCELVLTKLPVHVPDPSYDGAWSDDKHGLLQRYADEYGLKFLDLNYVDLDINWRTETADNGKHLNGVGAKKASRYFADWLSENFSFERKADRDESWQAQMAVYDHEMHYYDMQMEQDLDAYLDRLGDGDYTVLVAVSKEVGDYWTSQRQTQLEMVTGTHLDLYQQLSEIPAAFAVVGTCGTLLNEDMKTSDVARIEGELPDGTPFKVVSSLGADTKATSININGKDYSTQHNGLRFVVYDNELHCVVDVASVVIKNENYKITHSRTFMEEMRRHLLDYEAVALKDF